MPKQLIPPQTKHFTLSPHLFRQRFYRHYSIRIIINSASLPYEKQSLNKAILQNKITVIKGFIVNTSPTFVFITDLL